MPTLRLAGPALTLAVLVLTAGCGDSDSGSGSSTSGTSAADAGSSATVVTAVPGSTTLPAPVASSAAVVSTDPTATATVIVSELEDDIKKKLTDGGNSIDSVDCPDNVEARVGVSVDCHVKATDGREADYTVTLTSVEGAEVKYNAVPKV